MDGGDVSVDGGAVSPGPWTMQAMKGDYGSEARGGDDLGLLSSAVPAVPAKIYRRVYQV